jgi:hypothetical protein
MGFFDGLEKAWSNWGTNWSSLWGQISKGGSDFFHGLMNAAIPAANVAMTPFKLDDQHVKDQLTQALGQTLSGGAGVLGGAMQAPVVRQIGQTANWAQNEIVKRPMGTAFMALGDQANGKASLFDSSTWQDAYNSTRTVSTGQALLYSETGKNNPWTYLTAPGAALGKSQAKTQTNFDPRTTEGQQNIQNHWQSKLASGGMDALVDVMYDPTIGLGKVGRAAKLTYWSKNMRSSAVQKLLNGEGKWDGFVNSRSYQNTYQFIKDAKSPTQVQQTLFNNHYNGGVLANALWSVKDDPELYGTTYRALYGDPQAWEQLTAQAPRLADLTGTKFANYTISQVGKNVGLGDDVVDQAANNLMETKTQAFADSMANGKGFWGKIGKGVAAGGLLAGQDQPRLRLTSRWRVGVNQALNYGPNTMLGHWGMQTPYAVQKVTRTLLPSSRGGRQLDMNNPDSLRIFSNNLRQSRLDQGSADAFIAQYARATSPESRFRVANAAENAAFQAHAEAHNIDPGKIESILPVLNQFRSGNRAFLRANKRFISSTARKVGETYKAQDMAGAAGNMDKVANDLDTSVALGNNPPAHFAVPDEDGNLNLIPLESASDPAHPLLESQHADMLPMQDWTALDSALWWQGKGGLGKAIWKTREGTSALLEAASSVWKVSAILRPGYVWRTLSDEAGGPLAVMGAHKVMYGATEGVKNAFFNTLNRTAIYGDAVKGWIARDKAERLLTGARGTAVAGVAEDVAPAAASTLASRGATDPDYTAYNFGQQGYGSFDRALADGVLSVGDFMDQLNAHGEAGQLPHDYQAIHSSTGSELTKREAQQHAVDLAMSNTGSDVYRSSAWQQSVIDAANDARKNKAQGIPGEPLVVDPFSGSSPKIDPADIPSTFTLRGKPAVFPADRANFDKVYQFIHANADELLKPSSLLHAYVQPDGNIRLGVARYKGEGVTAVKPSGGVRVTAPFTQREGAAYRGVGLAGHDINVNGQQIHIRAAFEGGNGDLFKSQVQSKGPADMWVDRTSNSQHARLMANAPSDWINLDPSVTGYDTAWERAVNAQLANDSVAKRFLQGASVRDVVAWMHNTKDGRAYQAKMGPYLSRYYDQIYQVKGMVDTYLPWNKDLPEESQALRAAALRGEATIGDMKKVVTRDDFPQVHGASMEAATGVGYFNQKVKDWTASAFKVLSDMPNDKLLRFPFAADRYKFHVDHLLTSRADFLKAKGDLFTQADLDAIEGTARERTLVDSRKYLYDTMAQHDLGKGLRLVIPFGSALMDSAQKWGVVLRENPMQVANIWKLWSAPDRNGLIQDGDGNHLKLDEYGQEHWYKANPKTGALSEITDPKFKPNGKYVTFRLPVGSPTVDGQKIPMSINKSVFQTFLDLPTFGPLVSIPTNKFALSHPEFASNKFIQTFILPYGPSANSYSAAVPGNVQNWKAAIDAFRGTDTQNAEEQAMSVYMAEMVNFSQGKRTNAPTFEEARHKAAQMQGLRFLSRLSGVAGSFTSPYQPYVDYYHVLQQTDPSNADQRFYTEMGPEYFWLTSSVTRNVLGIPATLGAFQQYKKFGDLMEKYPDLASLISGADGAGTFNRAVYEAQKTTPIRYGTQGNMRQLKTLDQVVEDTQTRLGWVKWTKFSDALHADMAERGVTNLNQKGAEDLAANKAAFLSQNTYWRDPYGTTQISPWYKDYSSQDTSKIESRLTQMRQIVQDPRLQGRNDMRGLIDYLDARDGFKQAMVQAGIKQLTLTTSSANPTAKTKKSMQMAGQWAEYVFNLKQQNMAFSNLYDRWLSADDNLQSG